MKSAVAVFAFVGFIGRCSGAELPVTIHEPGGSAGSPGMEDASVPPMAADEDAGATGDCAGPPGLYADDKCERIAADLVAYSPSFPLWTDAADKDRFIYLPEHTQIDTSEPNRWTFPVGTRLYKTFSRDGLKLETRVLEKIAPPPGIESWTYVAYAWSEDQRSVTPADAEGVQDVLGTDHDIPSQAQCRSCHNQPGLDMVNGFQAIQLNHRGPGWTLNRLIERGRLVNGAGEAPNVSSDNAGLPGDATARAALGYLHANCGGCHGGPSPRAGFNLSAVVGMVELSDAPAFQAGNDCACLERWTGRLASDGSPYQVRIAFGSAEHSGIVGRMSVRGAREQMPPLGTEHVDVEGVAIVSRWIDSLAPASCLTEAVCPAPASPE